MAAVGIVVVGSYTHNVANGNTGGYVDIPNLVVPADEEWKIDDLHFLNLTGGGVSMTILGKWVNVALGIELPMMTSIDQGATFSNGSMSNFNNQNVYKQPFHKGLILPAGYKFQASGQATNGTVTASMRAILFATKRATA